jgi:hypothetical protein
MLQGAAKSCQSQQHVCFSAIGVFAGGFDILSAIVGITGGSLLVGRREARRADDTLISWWLKRGQAGELPWIRFFAGTFRCVEFLRENTFCDPLIVVRATAVTRDS